MTSLKGADAKDVASSVAAIASERIKADKEANAGKKKTGTVYVFSLSHTHSHTLTHTHSLTHTHGLVIML